MPFSFKAERHTQEWQTKNQIVGILKPLLSLINQDSPALTTKIHRTDVALCDL